MINPELDVRKLKYEFMRDGLCVIENFLDQGFADAFHEHLNTQPEEWWDQATVPTINVNSFESYSQNPINIAFSKENASQLSAAKAIAQAAHERGEFAYAFKRTQGNHYEQCECMECQFRRYVETPELLEFMSNLTGFKLTQPKELFASWYGKGDFLNMHQDGRNGTVGFVFNLTKNDIGDWRPDWGGNLFFTEPDNTNKIKKVIVPKHNSLSLFDIATTAGANHFVSHVNTDKAKRLAFTGWFA